MLNEDEIAGRVAMEIVAKNAREKGVMAIQRYEVRGNNYGEFPSSTGKFVLYADHESECRERERKAKIEGWMACSKWVWDVSGYAIGLRRIKAAKAEALRRYPEVKP